MWTDWFWATRPPIFPNYVSLTDRPPGAEGLGRCMARADVVIVGGGVNGTSTAFHLASRGVKNVLVLERRHLGAGATGKSGSLVRMHYTNEPESRLALESLKIFRDFRNAVGGDCGFEPIGFLQIVPKGYEAALARNVARQQRLGIKTAVVDPAQLAEFLPGCRTDDVGAAAWEPDSGFADPNATTFAFAEAARRLGASIETGREVTNTTLIGVELGTGHADPNSFNEGVDPDFVATCRRALAGRLPAMAEA